MTLVGSIVWITSCIAESVALICGMVVTRLSFPPGATVDGVTVVVMVVCPAAFAPEIPVTVTNVVTTLTTARFATNFESLEPQVNISKYSHLYYRSS